MSRAERLLALMQALHGRRTAVSGHALAAATGVSLRTLYRDIASLQAQGAQIDGAPGVGYLMRPGFLLPPMMFGPEEMEALALGLRWVADQGDAGLAPAARAAAARVSAVLPADLRREFEASSLLVGRRPGRATSASAKATASAQATPTQAPDLLRQALREERKLRLRYQDANGTVSERVVWPFALVYFEQARVLSAWCELRGAVRHFRSERILQATLLAEALPRRRQTLLREWQRQVRAEGRNILPEIDIMPT